MNKRLFSLVFSLLLYCYVPSVQAQCWEGTVIEVVDGTTLTVSRKQSRTTIKLYGIGVPARGPAFAAEARKTLQNLVLNKAVTVCQKKTHGSSASEVYVLKGFMLNVNREMIRKGLARSTVDEYKTLENIARKKHMGLWSDNKPVLPEQSGTHTAAYLPDKPPSAERAQKNSTKPSSGGLSVYKVTRAPQPNPMSDNNTQAPDPIIDQQQEELEALRNREQQRVRDDSLSLTDIDQFSIHTYVQDAGYESNGVFEIRFDYTSKRLGKTVNWTDGDVNCECNVVGHFSEGTSTRIARTSVILSSYTDRVFIDIPYTYLDDAFVKLNSCTVECRISAGIFDLKANDKVYLNFSGRPYYYDTKPPHWNRPDHYLNR